MERLRGSASPARVPARRQTLPHGRTPRCRCLEAWDRTGPRGPGTAAKLSNSSPRSLKSSASPDLPRSLKWTYLQNHMGPGWMGTGKVSYPSPCSSAVLGFLSSAQKSMTLTRNTVFIGF